eukprot:360224-Chlamydomonas_euryale.AAC.7
MHAVHAWPVHAHLAAKARPGVACACKMWLGAGCAWCCNEHGPWSMVHGPCRHVLDMHGRGHDEQYCCLLMRAFGRACFVEEAL